MGKIVLEEHVILDRQEHLDRWRTLVPFIPEQTRQQLIARLTDTSARGPRLVRRDRRDHRDEAPPSPPRSPRSSHSSPRRRPATSPARPSPPTAAAPPSEPAFSQRGDLGLHRLPRLPDMTAQRHRSSRRREHGQPAAGPQDKLNAQATNRERQVGPVDLSRQEIIQMLRRAGLADVAAAARTSLPDPVDSKALDQFCGRYGLSRQSLIERMGGSP